MGVKEVQIQRQICDYLALKGHTFWRVNNIPAYDPTRGTFRAMPKYSMAGVSDILLILKGVLWCIEVKGKSPQSDSQKEFERKVINVGAEYHIVRSVEDVIKLGLWTLGG